MNFAFPETSAAASIQRAAVAQYAAAASLLAQSLPDGAREEQRQMLLRLVAWAPPASLELFVAERQGRVVGAVLGMVSPGRVAAVWPPQLLPGELPVVAAELHANLLEALARHRVELLQAALHPHDAASASWLERYGYTHIADLLYLAAAVPERVPPRATPELEFRSYTPRERQRLASIVEATYEATLDCPRLDGWRTVEDVLDGYEATGLFNPARWLLVAHHGEDVGCLLLTAHADGGPWEILYMGLAATHRRRGWGRGLVAESLRRAAEARQQQLLVAVDRLNAPALCVYRQAGFAPWARRKVLARPLAMPAPSITTPPDFEASASLIS